MARNIVSVQQYNHDMSMAILPLFISMCMCEGRVNVAFVHVHVLGGQ
jgi:hypothetical protein